MSIYRAALAISLIATASPPTTANDLLALETSGGDITIFHDRRVLGFNELRELSQRDKSSLPIFLVTTKSKMPTAIEHDAALAYAKALQSVVPRVSFTIGEELKEASTYYVVVEETHGHNKLERDVTIYGSRTTAVQCTELYGVECRETGRSASPMGTKKVQLVDRFIDITFELYKFTKYGIDTPKVSADGNMIIAESNLLSSETLTMAYDADACKDEATPASKLAAMLAKNIFLPDPTEVRFQTTSERISCNR